MIDAEFVVSFSGSVGFVVRSTLALKVGGIPRGLLTGADDKRPVEDSWEEFGRVRSCFELVASSDVIALCDRDISCLVLVADSAIADFCTRLMFVSSFTGLEDTEVVLLEDDKSSLCSLRCVLLDDDRDEVGRGMSCWLW